MTDNVEIERSDLVKELGLLAIKTNVTLNAGAFIVLLTFVGNIAGDAAYVIEAIRLKQSLFCFLGGIVLSFVAIFTTYLIAQFQMAKGPTWWGHSLVRFLAIMVTPTFLSLGCFILGVVTAIVGIEIQ